MNRVEFIGKLNALYVGDKNCLEELLTTYDEQSKEIERLKENNQAMQEEMARTWKKLDEKENIIKEAIKYIESYMPNYDFDKTNLIKLLEILGSDKE